MTAILTSQMAISEMVDNNDDDKRPLGKILRVIIYDSR